MSEEPSGDRRCSQVFLRLAVWGKDDWCLLAFCENIAAQVKVFGAAVLFVRKSPSGTWKLIRFSQAVCEVRPGFPSLMLCSLSITTVHIKGRWLMSYCRLDIQRPSVWKRKTSTLHVGYMHPFYFVSHNLVLVISSNQLFPSFILFLIRQKNLMYFYEMHWSILFVFPLSWYRKTAALQNSNKILFIYFFLLNLYAVNLMKFLAEADSLFLKRPACDCLIGPVYTSSSFSVDFDVCVVLYDWNQCPGAAPSYWNEVVAVSSLRKVW